MSPLRAILFDFDLTLVDSRPPFLACHRYAAAKMGWPAPEDSVNLYRLMGRPLPQIIALLYPQASDAELLAYASEYHAHADEVMTGLTTWYPGVPEALQLLHKEGLKLGIVSQKRAYRLIDFLNASNRRHLFDAVLGQEDMPEPKPDPRGVLLALERLSLTPAEALYAGDTSIDAETARGAGTGFIAVLTGETSRELFAEYEPDAILASVAELPAYLTAIQAAPK